MDQQRHRRAACDDLGARLVGQHRDGALADGVRGELRAVGPCAGQRGEQVAGLDVLAAQRDPGDPW